MSKGKKVFLIVLVILIACWLMFDFVFRDSISVGLIGGADGPTSILVSRGNGNTAYLYAITVLLVISAFVVTIKGRK